jgi:hypothetical protein
MGDESLRVNSAEHPVVRDQEKAWSFTSRFALVQDDRRGRAGALG